MYMSLFVLENAIFDCYHVGYAWLLFRSLHHSPLMMTHCQDLPSNLSLGFPSNLFPYKSPPKMRIYFSFLSWPLHAMSISLFIFWLPLYFKTSRNRRILYWFSLFLLLESHVNPRLLAFFRGKCQNVQQKLLNIRFMYCTFSVAG